MNYKPGVRTGTDPKLYTNSLVFATREEALASANELSGRWLAVTGVGVLETEDPVNYRFVDGQNVPLEKEPADANHSSGAPA